MILENTDYSIAPKWHSRIFGDSLPFHWGSNAHGTRKFRIVVAHLPVNIDSSSAIAILNLCTYIHTYIYIYIYIYIYTYIYNYILAHLFCLSNHKQRSVPR